jgi:hypothetical protein
MHNKRVHIKTNVDSHNDIPFKEKRNYADDRSKNG